MQNQNAFHRQIEKNDQLYMTILMILYFYWRISTETKAVIIEIEKDDNKTATYKKEKKAISPSEDYFFHFWTYTLPHTLYGRGHFCISQIDLEVRFIVSRQIHVIFGQIVPPLHTIVKSIAEQIMRC